MIALAEAWRRWLVRYYIWRVDRSIRRKHPDVVVLTSPRKMEDEQIERLRKKWTRDRHRGGRRGLPD